MSQRLAIEDRLRQVDRDIEDLARQVASGEIDAETGARLRRTYDDERAGLMRELTAMPASPPTPRSRVRILVGGALLVAALAVSVGVAGQFVQRRDVDTLQGVADQADDIDLENISDEAMLAAINSFAGDPAVAEQLPRMRLALAERKLAKQEYDAAFDQLQAILQAEPPPSAEVAAPTLTRMAWIVWLNGETDLALQLVDRSTELIPSAPETQYVEAQILWCSDRDRAQAEQILADLVTRDSIDGDARTQMEQDLVALRSGGGCER